MGVTVSTPRRRAGELWNHALLFALAIACVVGAARLVSWTLNEQISFDGAMNLEVARSLAEGRGYERMYAGHSGFSHEIQSRAPYIVPAAAVFAAFGVGVWQAQLTNLLYVAALALVVFALVRRWTSWRWGLFAVALCLWVPGIREIAMNGYGEVPGLVWWLAAVLVLCGERDEPAGGARMFSAGVLAGMAVLTKTVLAVGLVAIVPLFVAQIVACRGSRIRFTVTGLFALGAGIVLPALAYELAHVAVLGDVGRWHAWLRDEMHAIHMQAGTAKGFKDTGSIGAKLLVHSRVLAESTGMPVPLLPFWIAAPIVLAAIGRRWFSSANARAAMLGLAVFAAVYFVWWLGFTPTEKAWYRRVFNGVLVLEILSVAMLAALWRLREQRPHQARAAAIAGFVLAALQVPLLACNIGSRDTSDFADAASLRDDLAAMQRVPADEEVYAAGWYSAPVLAVYSGRRFGNIATETPESLASLSPVYLVLDKQATNVGAGQYWLDRYAYRDIADLDSLHLVELDAKTPRKPFESVTIDAAAVRGRVDFHVDDYAYMLGFQQREGDGWRWAMADSELLLRYGGEAEFNVDVYIPALKGYRNKRDVGITVWLDGCRLGSFRQDENRRQRWWFPTRNCPLETGKNVAVRLTSDNLFESRDDRQLGYIVHALGFAEPAKSTPDSPDQR